MTTESPQTRIRRRRWSPNDTTDFSDDLDGGVAYPVDGEEVIPDGTNILHWKMISRRKDCAESHGAWDSTGSMRIARMSRGKPLVAFAHGILWFYMLGSYVLLGDALFQYVPWMLETPVQQT
ncbi:hypothetical protein N7454_001523 [Penicillium verhagenii]|nr:hypothetical protein N7454_001523 [Penicillium verhagenii]